MTDLLLVGRVARAHGNQGQVIVNLETDFPHERFADGHALIVVDAAGKTAERRIRSVRFHQGRPIVSLEGIDTMTAAEALAGAELKVPASSIAPLPADTYYRHDLVGCEVKDTAGRTIGRVVDVQGPIERSLLVIDDGRNEILVPMVEGMVVRMDPPARTIIVDPPDGLIELNASSGVR